MIGKTVAEKTGELVLNTAINKLNEYKSKKEWKDLFINTGEFFLKQVDGGEQIIEDMSVLLSSENMKELAKKTDEGSKYSLRSILHTELRRLMLQYEVPALEAEFFISGFVKVIMSEIEKINPVAFECAYLSEWREIEEQQLVEIKDAISLVNIQLKEIQSKNVEVYSLDQAEIELAKQTVNPSLDLEFFEIDDELFKESFEDHIDDECVYVSGQCKEETIYCVLNELRRINTGKVVFVVKKEEDWKNLRLANEEHPELGGKILIPWFSAEQIYAIPNNTNIFVYGEEEYSVGKDVISVRKRKRSTIVKKLEQAGMSYEAAYAMVDDTHGLYIPLKKKLIRGQYNIVPDWVGGEDDLIIPLLLCGQWTEAEGDQVVLEELCGRKYEQIVEGLQPYMKGEDPLFIKFKVHGRVIYHLASVENAWDYLDYRVVVGDKRWKKYVDCVLEIIAESDPMFDYPEEKQHYAELLPNGRPFWSATLKKGMLRSFVMKAYYKKNIENQNAIDIIVGKILGEIKSQKQWLSIATYFSILCEASPKAITSKLDDEWTNSTGLIEVFAKDEGNSPFSKNYYTHFIWGIEQFLLQKEYAAWAVRWFFKMHNLGIKYTITNSPKDTLKKIFCTWYNVTVLSQEEKLYLVKEAFEEGYDIWGLIYDELPGRHMHMMGTTSKPRYRIVEETIKATNGDMWLANKEYLTLCLKHMEFNSERWIKIIEAANHYGKNFMPTIFEKLDYELSYMDDSEIILIKNVIRNEIYRHRYFANSEWAMKEDILSYYQDALERIKTKNPVYEYEYLFAKEYDFPLLHPYPYSENEKREKNEHLRNEEIRNGMLQFKEQGLNVEELVLICSKHEYSTLGKYLFDIYCNKTFDEELFILLISKAEYKNIMNLYVRIAYLTNQDYLNQAVTIAKSYNVSRELLISLLLIEELDVSKTPLINYENEEIKGNYWKNVRRYNHKDDEATCRFVVKEMCKYSDQVTLIDTLQDCIKYFAPEEILKLMEEMHTLEVGDVSTLSSYSFKSILEVLQQEYQNSESCMRVARLELIYRGLLEWEEMICFKKSLEVSPQPYADMVAIIYKKDDGEVQQEKTYEDQIISNVYSLFYDAKFCPAESEGKVNKEKLFGWIAELKELLAKQKQASLFTYLLGRALANSPIGEDGYYPCESVREAIQEYGDECLENEYVISIFNQRGVFSPTGGTAERELAKKYKRNADAMRTKYSKVASIYDKLCEKYLYDADSERECEEYAGI